MEEIPEKRPCLQITQFIHLVPVHLDTKTVYNCCIEGCPNSTITRKREPTSVLSFHAFPSNQKLKNKWLRAIGRPNWDPPRDSKICTIHFDAGQIKCCDGSRVILKDDAIPMNALPPNFNVEASNVETCRICLATDIKMYNIKNGSFSTYFDSLIGDTFKLEGLPQFVCYLCAADVMKCYRFLQKSMTAHKVLRDIYIQYGQITKNYIKKHDLSQLNLTKLAISNTSHLQHVDEIKIEHLNKVETMNRNTKTNYKFKSKAVNKDSFKVNQSIGYKLENISDEESKNYITTEDVEMDNEYKFGHKVSKVYTIADNMVEYLKSDTDSNLSTPIDDMEPEFDQSESEYEEKHNEENSDSKDDESVTEKYCMEVDLKTEGDCELEENILSTTIEYMEPEFEIEYEEKTNEVNIDSKSHDDEIVNESIKKTEEIKINKRNMQTTNSAKIKRGQGLTGDETLMQEYYKIVQLSLKQQLKAWKSAVSQRYVRSINVYECEICGKKYKHLNLFKAHITNHDPSNGEFECPVCKFRFQNEKLAKSHQRRDHGKKFYCKSCPKEFLKLRAAKLHQQRLHSSHTYKCTKCPYTDINQSGVNKHMLCQHKNWAECAECGRAFVSTRDLKLHQLVAHTDPEGVKDRNKSYRCEDCDINFASERARSIHILSSSQHAENPDSSDELATSDIKRRYTCTKCGDLFPTVTKLKLHRRTEHPRDLSSTSKNSSWKCSNDSYPTQCQLCDETVNSRRQHWLHVRRMHPAQKDTYQPLIGAVCDTCGKGFQHSAQLKVHKRSHAAPSVRCPQCPRLFHDQYALARHAPAHSDARPYVCTICGFAFKMKTNLFRHAKVHTDEATYKCTMCGKMFKYSTSLTLHVRTVHYKMPHPPRKKRN